MRPNEIKQEINKLNLSEKLLLIEDVWDSIAQDNSELTMPEWQKKELDRRKTHLQNNPDSGLTWEDVKTRVRRFHDR